MQTTTLSKGFTLAEILVAAGLAFLVLVLSLQFILPAMRISMRTQARTQMQQSCIMALQRIRTDLDQTNAAAIGYVNQGVGQSHTVLALQPLRPEVVNNLPAYEMQLVSYHWTTDPGMLMRRRWEPPPSIPGATFLPDQPLRLMQPQLNLLPGLIDFKESRQICPDVSGFSIASAVPPPNVGNPLRIRLDLKKRDDSCTLEQTVLLRNSP